MSKYVVPWKFLNVIINPRTRIVGGVPNDPNMIANWLKANMPNVTEDERAKLAQTTIEAVQPAVDEAAGKMWTTFKRDEKGLYIEGRQLKAAFKEAANILREALQKQEKAEKKSRFTGIRSKLAEHLFVEDERIYLVRNGEPVKTPTGTEERAINVITAQGPRTALKRVDFVAPEGLELRARVRYLDAGIVDADLVGTLIEFMGWNGLGADRSLGSGQFEGRVEVVP